MATWDLQSRRPLAETILDGLQAGIVYADDPVYPRTALMCPASGFYFACGEPRADLVAEALPEIRKRLVAKAWRNATSEAWRTALSPLLKTAACRLGFEHDGIVRELPPVPPDYQLVAMQAVLAEDWNSGSDVSGLDPWIFAIWGGPHAFESRSFGMAVLHGVQPVAFAAACAIGAGEAEVEVGTSSDFRPLGLGTISSLAFMAECTRRGLRATWTCGRDNEASIALAARLGYRPTEVTW